MTTQQKDSIKSFQSYALTVFVTVVITIMGFYLNRLYTQVDDKVDNKVLIQYMKLIEERNAVQLNLNKENKAEHKEIIKQLNDLNEKIHNLDIKVIGFITTRGNIERWNYEAVALFMLEGGVFDKRYKTKYVGLI